MADSYNEIFGLGSHSEDAALEGWWPLQDDAASTAIVDQSSNSRNGTLEGGDNTADKATTGPNDWLTSALAFNGSDDRIIIPAAAMIGGASERHYSIRFLANSFGAANQEPIFDFGADTAPNSGRGLNVFAEEQAVSIAFFAHRVITPKSALSTGVFYQASVRVPSGATTTADVDILIDGVNQTLSTEAGSAQTLNTIAPDPGYVGHAVNAAEFIEGTVTHLASFSRALTDAEDAEIGDGPEPVNSVAPALSGTETEGETLSVTTGTWGLDAPFAAGSHGTITYGYQWTRSDDDSGTNEADIGGATNNTYTLTATDVGKFIRCRVRATNNGGFDADADTNSDFSGAIQAAAGGAVPIFMHHYKQLANA